MRERDLVILARLSVAAAVGRRRAVEARLRDARRARLPRRAVEEALLQLHLFAGYPRMLSAFDALSRLWPGRPGRPDRTSHAAMLSRGTRLCRRIYGTRYDPMIRRMRAHHADLPAFIVRDGYGRVLSRPGLDAREREALAVVVLARLEARDQFPSHLNGARRVGLPRDVLERVLGASIPAPVLRRLRPAIVSAYVPRNQTARASRRSGE